MDVLMQCNCTYKIKNPEFQSYTRAIAYIIVECVKKKLHLSKVAEPISLHYGIILAIILRMPLNIVFRLDVFLCALNKKNIVYFVYFLFDTFSFMSN